MAQSKAKVKQLVNDAFLTLSRGTQSDSEADKLLDRALSSALDSERRHRRMAPSGSRWLQSAETAARFFVVKWFAEPRGKVKCARDACSLREDCLYAMALAEVVRAEGLKVDSLAVKRAAALDYVSDFVGGAY